MDVERLRMQQRCDKITTTWLCCRSVGNDRTLRNASEMNNGMRTKNKKNVSKKQFDFELLWYLARRLALNTQWSKIRMEENHIKREKKRKIVGRMYKNSIIQNIRRLTWLCSLAANVPTTQPVASHSHSYFHLQPGICRLNCCTLAAYSDFIFLGAADGKGSRQWVGVGERGCGVGAAFTSLFCAAVGCRNSRIKFK